MAETKRITEFICARCRMKEKHKHPLLAGYVTNKAGEKVCYDCDDMLTGLKQVRVMGVSHYDCNWCGRAMAPLIGHSAGGKQVMAACSQEHFRLALELPGLARQRPDLD